MEFGNQFGVLEILIVVLHELLPGLLVEGALWEGYDEQAFYDLG